MASVNRDKILLPSVAAGAAPEEKKLAERVDKVFGSLKEQLRTFESASTLTVGGVSAASIASGSNAMYFQAFEDPVDEDWNLRAGSTSVVSYTNNGKAGGIALRATGGEVWMAGNVNIIFDPDRLYRIRTRVRAVSGSGTVTVGVEGVGSDGTTLVDRAGGTDYSAMHEVCLDSAISSTSWVTYSGYFKGVAATGTATSPATLANAPRVLHDDVRYMRPFIAMNRGGGTGTLEIDYVTLEVLTETSEIDELVENIGGRDVDTVAGTVKSDGDVNTDRVANASIKSGAVSGGGESVGAKNHIATGSIVAANIKALTINAALITSLTGSGLTLDFHAGTGATDEVISHSGFKLYGNGDAVFSGEVASSSFTASTAKFVDGSTSAVDISANRIRFGAYNALGNSGSVSLSGNTLIISTSSVDVLTTNANVSIGGEGPSWTTAIGNLKASGNLGFFGSAPVSKTGTSTAGGLITVSGSGDDATINSNFSTLRSTLNSLITALQSYNLV